MRTILIILIGLSALLNVLLLAIRQSVNLGPELPGSTASSVGPGPSKTMPAPGRGQRMNANILYSKDPTAFVANLRAAGVPPHIIRAIVTALLDEEYAGRELNITGVQAQGDWWHYQKQDLTTEQRLALLDLHREKTKRLQEILGPDMTSDWSLGQIVSPSKRALLETIEEDYGAMMAELSRQMTLYKLPAEQRELAMLQTARATDLAALLDARELTDYEKATSPIMAAILPNLRYFSASEPEFDALYAAEQEKEAARRDGSGITPAVEADWDRQLRTVMGDKRFTAYEASRIPEFQSLTELVARNGLPVDVVTNVYTTRQKLSEQSMKIGQDGGKTDADRAAALTLLAAETRNEITRTLGPDVARTYLQSANLWIQPVERGEAVTFFQSGWSSVRVVPPPANSKR